MLLCTGVLDQIVMFVMQKAALNGLFKVLRSSLNDNVNIVRTPLQSCHHHVCAEDVLRANYIAWKQQVHRH